MDATFAQYFFLYLLMGAHDSNLNNNKCESEVFKIISNALNHFSSAIENIISIDWNIAVKKIKDEIRELQKRVKRIKE